MSIEEDIKQYINTKDKSLRDRIIMSQYALVIKQVKKYVGQDNLGFDDLVNEGMVGVTKALDKFNPDLGYKFTTFAGSLSLGHIKDAIKCYNSGCGFLQENEEFNDELYSANTHENPLDYCCYVELANRIIDYLNLIKPARKTVFLYWAFAREYSRNNTESDPEWASRVDLCQVYQGVKKYLRKHIINQEYDLCLSR